MIAPSGRGIALLCISDNRQSRAGLRDVRMVDSRKWVKISTSIDESLVTNVEEIREG